MLTVPSQMGSSITTCKTAIGLPCPQSITAWVCNAGNETQTRAANESGCFGLELRIVPFLCGKAHPSKEIISHVGESSAASQAKITKGRKESLILWPKILFYGTRAMSGLHSSILYLIHPKALYQWNQQQRLECGKSPVERRFYLPLKFSFKGIMAPFSRAKQYQPCKGRSLISASSNISAQRWDLSNCMKIISSGVPFSAKYSSVAPQCILNDPVVPQESWPLVSCRHQMQV